MTLTRKTLFLLTAAFGTHSLQTTSADAVVKAEKLHASANRSYKVAGKRYTPKNQVAEFTQTGNASWYGGRFHGRKTSGGERYDMNAFTAAHKTLPIPSYVRVTNTKNGKSVIVRVNDRGPFHGNRIIDVSKAAAQKLGFVSQGTAHVKTGCWHNATAGRYCPDTPFSDTTARRKARSKAANGGETSKTPLKSAHRYRKTVIFC